MAAIRMITDSQIDGCNIPSYDIYSVYSVVSRHHHTMRVVHNMYVVYRWQHIGISMSGHVRMGAHAKRMAHLVRMACHIKDGVLYKGMSCLNRNVIPVGYLLRGWPDGDLSHPAMVKPYLRDGGVVHSGHGQAHISQSKAGNLLNKWQQCVIRHYYGDDAGMVGLWLAAARGGVVPLEDGDRATLTHRPARRAARTPNRCQRLGYGKNGLNNASS